MVNFATMATGTLNFGLFVLPMSDDLGMSRGFIGWSQTTRMLAGGVSGFILGRLLDRHGPRVLIAVASLTTGACMVGLVYIQDAWQFLLLFSVMGLIGLSAPGGLLTSVPVAKWFVRQRGKALAMATMGLGVGGIAFDSTGRRLFTSGQDGTIRVYAIDVDDLIGLAEERLG